MEKRMIKTLKKTKHFNKGQKVFVLETTGAMAMKCRGRFRGSGRYVNAWYKWNSVDSAPKMFDV